MAGKSRTHTDSVLNILRNVAISGVASPHVGLLSAAPADDSLTGTELSGNGYARQPVTFGAPVTDTGNVRKISNTATCTFGPASADWLQAVAFAIYDAVSGGSILYWDYLQTAKTVQTADYAAFDIGNLQVKED